MGAGFQPDGGGPITRVALVPSYLSANGLIECWRTEHAKLLHGLRPLL